MALNDRSYMRYNPSEQNQNLLGKIIIITIIAFVIQKMSGILMGSPNYSVVDQYFSFSSNAVFSGRFWTFLSYALLHGSPFHLFINMIMAYFFGRTIEAELGSKRFLSLYLITVGVGALSFLILNMGFRPNSQTPNLYGASAATMGMIALFCLRNPNERISFLVFFILPIEMQAKRLLQIVLGLEVLGLMSELTGGQIASSAHLGGILGAWIFLTFVLKEGSLFEQKIQKKSSHTGSIWPQAKSSSNKPRFTINLTNRNELKKEVDRILDKINSSGFGSLSEDEKKTLDKAKDLLHK